MSYFYLVWKTATNPEVVREDFAVVLQETRNSIEFVNSALLYSKDAAIRELSAYEGYYASEVEAEKAAVAKLTDLCHKYQELANRFRLALEVRKPAEQIIGEVRRWVCDQPNLQQVPKGQVPKHPIFSSQLPRTSTGEDLL